MAVGEQLLLPKSGTQRFDDIHSSISYVGSEWSIDTYAQHYNGSMHASFSTNAIARFNIMGTTLLRLITDRASNRNNSPITVYIDGVSVGTFTTYRVTGLTQCLSFEVLGLSTKEHYVSIVNSDCLLSIDAIDIDSNGDLKPYNPNLNKQIPQAI